MGAGIRAVRDAVAVDVEIAAEILAGIEIGCRHHFAAVVFAAVVPFQRTAQAVVHADVEIEHDEDRGLQAGGKGGGGGAAIEGLGRVFRGKQEGVCIAGGGGGGRGQ